jgi:hypothetical protein
MRRSAAGMPTLRKTFQRFAPSRFCPCRPRWQRTASPDLVRDRIDRIERGHRLLEDHADLVAAHPAHGPFIERRQVGHCPALPRKQVSPPTMRPGGVGMSRMTERLVTDLPLPDSPTIASVSPRMTFSETPSTALATPLSVAKWVLRSRISRIASPSMAPPVPIPLHGLAIVPHLPSGSTAMQSISTWMPLSRQPMVVRLGGLAGKNSL